MQLNKKYISNLFFAAVFFALLFPLGHSFSHFFDNNLHEKCHHKIYDKTNFEHKHKVNDHCSICDFNLKLFLNSDFFKEFKTLSFSLLRPNFSLFKNFSLKFIDLDSSPRGPPYFNVI